MKGQPSPYSDSGKSPALTKAELTIIEIFEFCDREICEMNRKASGCHYPFYYARMNFLRRKAEAGLSNG